MLYVGRRTADSALVHRFIATMIVSLAGAAVYAIDTLLPAAAQTAPTQAPQKAEPQQPAKPESPSAPVKGETPATVLDDKDVEGILGKEIYSATGEDMGRIVDVLVDRNGDVRAAIIDFGGFLGVGSRKIAVDWRAIQFSSNGKLDRIVLSLTRNEVRVAPEYKQGEPIVVLGRSPAPQTPSPSPAPTAPAAPTK